MNKTYWYYSIQQKESFYHSKYYTTKQNCLSAARWHILNYKNLAYAETLKINKVPKNE